MQARGVQDILAVDLSAAMLAEVEKAYVHVGTLGNDLGEQGCMHVPWQQNNLVEQVCKQVPWQGNDLDIRVCLLVTRASAEAPLFTCLARLKKLLSCRSSLPYADSPPPLYLCISGVRTWCGDVVDLPPYLTAGSEAIFMNSCFGNMHSPRDALLRASLMLRPGGRVVVSHPLGRKWLQGLKASKPEMVSQRHPSFPLSDSACLLGCHQPPDGKGITLGFEGRKPCYGECATGSSPHVWFCAFAGVAWCHQPPDG